MSVAAEAVALAATVLGILAAVTGFGLKYILLPWLKTNLVDKVEETHHQVTVNAHASPEPTVLDKLDTLAEQVEDLHAGQRILSTVLSNHIENTRETS